MVKITLQTSFSDILLSPEVRKLKSKEKLLNYKTVAVTKQNSRFKKSNRIKTRRRTNVRVRKEQKR